MSGLLKLGAPLAREDALDARRDGVLRRPRELQVVAVVRERADLRGARGLQEKSPAVAF